MSSHPDWIRAKRRNPCPICGRMKFCLLSRTNDDVICTKIEEGSVKWLPEASGWLHREKDSSWTPSTRAILPPHIEPPKIPTQKLECLDYEFRSSVNPMHLNELAQELGVSVRSLEIVGIGWFEDEGCWTFPLYDGSGTIVGINRRFPDGSKFVISGHRTGLYLPDDLPLDLSGEMLLICEGGTDLAAAIDMGFHAAGRFCCTHGCKQPADLLRRRRPGVVAIISDSKLQEQRGAQLLSDSLRFYCDVIRLVIPPAGIQDLRAWASKGLTRTELEDLIVNKNILDCVARRKAI